MVRYHVCAASESLAMERSEQFLRSDIFLHGRKQIRAQCQM
jgi:hypothetical protein